MRQKKDINKQSLIKLFEPISEYLIGIDTIFISETETQFAYKLGVPKNWVMNTNLIDIELMGETDDLMLLKASPINNEKNKDEFYGYLVNLINKNVVIDKKRIELENKINDLKSKFTKEQDNLMNELNKELEAQESKQNVDSTDNIKPNEGEK